MEYILLEVKALEQIIQYSAILKEIYFEIELIYKINFSKWLICKNLKWKNYCQYKGKCS